MHFPYQILLRRMPLSHCQNTFNLIIKSYWKGCTYFEIPYQILFKRMHLETLSSLSPNKENVFGATIGIYWISLPNPSQKYAEVCIWSHSQNIYIYIYIGFPCEIIFKSVHVEPYDEYKKCPYQALLKSMFWSHCIITCNFLVKSYWKGCIWAIVRIYAISL